MKGFYTFILIRLAVYTGHNLQVNTCYAVPVSIGVQRRYVYSMLSNICIIRIILLSLYNILDFHFFFLHCFNFNFILILREYFLEYLIIPRYIRSVGTLAGALVRRSKRYIRATTWKRQTDLSLRVRLQSLKSCVHVHAFSGNKCTTQSPSFVEHIACYCQCYITMNELPSVSSNQVTRGKKSCHIQFIQISLIITDVR